MELEADRIRGQVDRLVNSKTFETSEVHRRLLVYLTEKTIAGEADRLKEYTIGLEAFGKPDSYDPKHDSIVRLQVGRLRQKLSSYYQTEANGDALVVTLPKGAYKLAFEEPTAKEVFSAAEPAPPRRTQAWVTAGLVMVLLWAIGATVLAVRWHASAAAEARWSTDLEKLWAPFLQTNRPLVVCMGMPLFIRLPEFGFFRDPRTNDWQELDKSARVNSVRKSLGAGDVYASYAFTGAGEASAAVLVSQLLGSRKREVQLTRSNLLSWQQVAASDVVFVGPPKFNVQLQAAALKQEIVIEPDGIRNLKPNKGEPVFLEDHVTPGKPAEGETHALISHIPGLSNVGELLVIGGNASSDTLGAAEWLTQPQKARELFDRLRNSRGDLPKYYQVVLKVVFKQGIPVQSSYVFHHVIAE